jgi:DNA-binding Lrp family transcriptional regulator
MYKIDLKDRKILYELDTNSRQPFSEMAKKVGLSKDSVIYRINSLQKEGIIKQFHTVIDVGKLGYISFRLYLKLQNATPQKEAEIIEYLNKNKCIAWIASLDGEYDIGTWILAKSIKEMNVLWKDLLKKYINFIENRKLTIWTKISYFPRAYLLEKPQNLGEYVFITEPEEIKIDDKDLELLKLLAPDARISVVDLSKKLFMTPKTVAAKIRDLEKRKIIIGYRTLFDLDKLGYQYFKLHINLKNVTEEKEKKFRQYVKQHPNIVFDNEVLGGDDFEIEIQVKDLQEFRLVVEDIKKHFSDMIKDHKYFLIYKEHKFVFLPV